MTDTLEILSSDTAQASAEVANAMVKAAQAGDAVAARAPLTIRQTIIAQYAAIEPEMSALAERYRDVVYDVSTAKGLAEARAARHDLRENGRYFLNRSLEAKKEEINDGKALMESETERLVAIVKAPEDLIHKQITDREAILKTEKEARERIAAERKEKFEARIAGIRAAVDRCAGISAERIANGIAMVEDMAFGTDWAEFAAPAAAAQAETLAKMRALHADACTRERAAAEAEARRIEQERIAAEQAAEASRLKAEADEIAAERAELERERAELDRARADREAEAHVQAEAQQRAEREAAHAETARIAAAAQAQADDRQRAAAQQEREASALDEAQEASAILASRDADAGAAPMVTDDVDLDFAELSIAQVDQVTETVANTLATDCSGPGPIKFVEPEPPAPISALLSHIRAEFKATKFPSQPKPSIEWWAELRRLSEEVVL